MSFQAYLDSVKAKTGKTPQDFAVLAAKQGLAKHGDLVKWLKADHSLGHGHATAIAGIITKMGAPKPTRTERIDALFAGKKQRWRATCDGIVAKTSAFGSDTAVGVGGAYLSLLRDGKKFAILQPSSADRLDIGIKLKGAPVDDRFAAAGTWNAMVTHRVRIHEPAEADKDVLAWLKRAYEAAA